MDWIIYSSVRERLQKPTTIFKFSPESQVVVVISAWQTNIIKSKEKRLSQVKGWPKAFVMLQFHFILLLFDVLLALLLVGGMSQPCIIYHNYKGWNTHNFWSCWILLGARHRRDTSRVSSHLWILSWCHMDNISFGSFWLGLRQRADILCWVLGYCSLLSYPNFLELMLCSLSRCCDGGCVLN